MLISALGGMSLSFSFSGAWAVDVLFILNYLRVKGFELGLDGVVAGGRRGAVGATTSLGHVVVIVLELGDALTAPVSAVCQRFGLLRAEVLCSRL